MDSIWLHMTRIFGHRWVSSMGTADDGTWLSVLQSLTPEQVRRGLEAVVRAAEAWPPTLPEFYGYCLGKTGGRNEFGQDWVPQYYRPAIVDNARLLTTGEHDASRQTALRELAKMRAILAGRPPPPPEPANGGG